MGTDTDPVMSNNVEFLKPLDIRFPIPTAFAANADDFEAIDLQDLGIDFDAITLDSDGNIVYLETRGGRHAIGFGPVIETVIIPVLEAIINGATLEEINQTVTEGLETLAENGTGNGIGGGTTMIDTDEESLGRIANQVTLSNCNCGNPITQDFAASLEGIENIDISFPIDVTENDRALALITLRALLGLSNDVNQSVSLSVPLDKCSTAVVTSQEVIRTVTGTILGFPFTYTGTDRLETTVVVEQCPITTPCHQGCPE